MTHGYFMHEMYKTLRQQTYSLSNVQHMYNAWILNYCSNIKLNLNRTVDPLSSHALGLFLTTSG